MRSLPFLLIGLKQKYYERQGFKLSMRNMMFTNLTAIETRAYDCTIDMLSTRALDLATSRSKTGIERNRRIDYKVLC